MIGILPEASDWKGKTADGRIICIGAHHYGEGFNMNCVLQSDATNGGDQVNDFILIHQVTDVQNKATEANADAFFQKFVDDSNDKLAALNVKVEIPKRVFERFQWHFRWSLSFDKTTGKIVFTKP